MDKYLVILVLLAWQPFPVGAQTAWPVATGGDAAGIDMASSDATRAESTPEISLSECLTPLAAAGDVTYRYQISRKIGYHGKGVIRAKLQHGVWELSGETMILLLGRKLGFATRIPSDGSWISEQFQNGGEIITTMGERDGDKGWVVRTNSSRTGQKEYRVPASALPVAPYYLPFLLRTRSDFTLFVSGKPCWVVRAKPMAPPAIPSAASGSIQAYQLAALQKLEGAEENFPAETLHKFRIECDAKNGMLTTLSTVYLGFEVRVWR